MMYPTLIQNLKANPKYDHFMLGLSILILFKLRGFAHANSNLAIPTMRARLEELLGEDDELAILAANLLNLQQFNLLKKNHFTK